MIKSNNYLSMKIKSKTLSILLINSSFYLVFFVTTELLLGNWIKNFFTLQDYIPIPGLIKDRVLMYDAKKIFSSSKTVPIIYTRDKLGYRSRDFNKNKLQILTLGGSSTDQRYTTDGKTWQDNLDIIEPRFDFINGGVDGQSSYGHLTSIRLWHSKSLNPDDVAKIIFYIGVNESLKKNYISKFDFAKTPFQYFKWVVRENSFYIIKITKIVQNFKNKYSPLKEPIVFINQHKARPIDFLDKGIYYKLENFNSDSFPEYIENFTNLLNDTQKYFPKSKIIVIQQQVPGCSFINQFEVNDRYPDKTKTRCLDLINIFQIQKEIVNSQKFKDKIDLVPMYLKKILNDDDVYDYTHTNNIGSMKIAKFIKSIL